MRLVSFVTDGLRDVGLLSGDGLIRVGPRLGTTSLRQILAEGRMTGVAALRAGPVDCKLADVTFLPVIPDPLHFYCVGTNYADHLKEVQDAGIARPTPKAPALFTRFPETLAAERQPILIPGVSDSLDYEGELAVVIGKPGRYIAEADALAHVAGYACFNDASVRDWQFHTSQVTSGKNFLQTGGFGPWMVTADEVPDPLALTVTTRVNGRVLQHGSTRDMIFSVSQIVAYASALVPLMPGDVIATGTPSGVGFSRKPPLFLADGDICEVSVEGIGTLTNPVSKERI